MSETDPTPAPQSTLKKTSPARSGCGVTALNFLLLLLSAILLFVVATDREPVEQLSMERWEMAIEKLDSLVDRITGRETIPSGDPVAVASTALDQAAVVSEELQMLAEELTHARTTIAALVSDPEALLLPSAPKRTVPLGLATFLKESRTTEFQKTIDQAKLDSIRASLVGLINEMSGLQRDELRAEIRDANWLLEALDITVGAPPTTFEERIGQFTSLSLLAEDSPEGVPDDLADDLARRRSELAAHFKKDLDSLVAAFTEPEPAITDPMLQHGLLLADVLADDLDPTQRALPAWIEEWLEWQDRIKPLLSGEDNAAIPNRVSALTQFLQQGQLLEQDLVAYSLPLPNKLSTDLEALRSSLLEIEQAAVGKYQLWALNEIQTARDLAGEKAVKAITEALSLGKSDPAAAARNKRYQKMIQDYPTFRRKLLQLSNITESDYKGEFQLNANKARQISEALNALTGWTGSRELAQCLNRDLLEQRLLPIEEGLLRRPIDSLYSEVFQECWNYLEGSPLRFAVAKTAATIKKHQVEHP